MPLEHGFPSASKCQGGFVAIGNFDGVHLGHQRIIGRLGERAREHDVPSIVLTFDPHPIQLLAPSRMPPQLSTLAHRAELLTTLGVDHVIAYPTDAELLAMSPDTFFNSIIRSELKSCGMVEGPNFYFGKDRAGDIDLLQRLCQQAGLTLDVVSAEQIDNRVISSSEIRSALRAGDVSTAKHMLGRPYRLSGSVVQGAQRGRTIGFPTANLANVATQIPADSVYAGRVEIDGNIYRAAINIGPNPTFDDDTQKIEVHLIDFSGDIYGRTLDVDLLDRVRAVQSFDSREALVEQLECDVNIVRSLGRTTGRKMEG